MDPVTLIVCILFAYAIIRLWPFILMLCVGWLVWNVFVIVVNMIFINADGTPFL